MSATFEQQQRMLGVGVRIPEPSWGSMLTTASASMAASSGEVAQRAPRAIRSSAFALLLFQTATVKPASR